MKKPGSVIIPDNSNGPKVRKQPQGCHCHCLIMVFGSNGKNLLVDKICHSLHPGKGGWWKNNDCVICTP